MLGDFKGWGIIRFLKLSSIGYMAEVFDTALYKMLADLIVRHLNWHT